jgi:uncharacterized damage-inducible protein DinB
MASVAAELFGYHTWANVRLIEFCAGLDEAQLETTAPTAYGSIRDTLAHIVAGEASFVRALGGELPQAAEPVGLAEIAARARCSGEALQAIAGRTRASRMLRMQRRGAERRIPAVALLAQAMNHAAEHRAQVIALLGQLGLRPPDMSGWAYGGDHSRDYA